MPTFFIVGAARSGTTSLDRYLSQHPEIYITQRKETHFFAANHFPRSGPGDEGLNRRVIHDEEQYTQLFAGVAGEKEIGESSVFYLCFPGVAERIARSVPGAKIIILLREPVERAYSAYMHLVRDGRETLGFAEGLSKEEERRQQGFEPMWWYKELGLYYSQIKYYLDVFGRDQVKVLLYNELYTNLDEVLREVFAFLTVKEDVMIDTSIHYNPAGVPKSRKLYTLLNNFIHNPGTLEKRVKSLVPPQLRAAWASKAMATLLRPVPPDPWIQAQLKEYFAEDVRKLEHLLQRDLQCWNNRESAPLFQS